MYDFCAKQNITLTIRRALFENGRRVESVPMSEAYALKTLLGKNVTCVLRGLQDTGDFLMAS